MCGPAGVGDREGWGRGSGGGRPGCHGGRLLPGFVALRGSPWDQDLQQEVVVGEAGADLLTQFLDGLQVSLGSPIEQFVVLGRLITLSMRSWSTGNAGLP